MHNGDKTMSGKICLVTGATSGIGAATARSLARLGATVVVAGRDVMKCTETVHEIRRVTGNASVEYLMADLAVQEQIRGLAKQFKEKYDRLDVLINNAGARFLSRSVSADGYEMTFALNHMASFTLTNLLLKELLTSRRGRIVNVASGSHSSCTCLNFADLQGERSFNSKNAYAQSKLANLYFTYELSRQLEGTELTVNALDPGNVLTNFSRNNGWRSWARHLIGSLLSGRLVGPQEGAKTSVYLASSPEVEGVSGKYFFNGAIVDSSQVSYDLAATKRLWELSAELAQFQTG